MNAKREAYCCTKYHKIGIFMGFQVGIQNEQDILVLFQSVKAPEQLYCITIVHRHLSGHTYPEILHRYCEYITVDTTLLN
jgi:hypothetical protein